MQENIELARGTIAADVLSIALIRHPGRAELVAIRWPSKPTEFEPSKLPSVTTAIFAMFADARIQLAAIRAAE